MELNLIDWNKIDIIDFLKVKTNEIKNLPNGVNISTMCASCKLNTNINIDNIENYMLLNPDDVLCVKKNKEKERTIIPKKEKNKRNNNQNIKKNTNSFYNQITVIMRIGHGKINNWEEEPKINLKLFKNGSIQMSGCKNITGINIALNKLLFKLRQERAEKKNNIIQDIIFVEDAAKLDVSHFKVDMINSNYQVNIQIDRAKLIKLLTLKKIKSSYEPCIRACVIIKYIPLENNKEEKEISIFVFQKGNIIITGAKTKEHIVSAYKYINNILLTHYDDIHKKDEDEEGELIMNIYNNIMSQTK